MNKRLLFSMFMACIFLVMLPATVSAQSDAPPEEVTFSCRQTGGWAGPLGVPFPDARVFQFGVEKSPNVTSVLWEFHDGTTSTADAPTFVYRIGGPYTVTLTCFGPPEFAPLRVSGSVTLRDDSNIGIAPTATATPLPPPTDPPPPTDLPQPTPTLRETLTPSVTPTASNTPRPRPTNTPGPSPTPRPSNTPRPTPVRVVCAPIGLDIPDPNRPTVVEFYITGDGENIDAVRWEISEIGEFVAQTPPDFRIGPITFTQSGLYTVSAEAVNNADNSIPADCGQIVVQVNLSQSSKVV